MPPKSSAKKSPDSEMIGGIQIIYMTNNTENDLYVCVARNF